MTHIEILNLDYVCFYCGPVTFSFNFINEDTIETLRARKPLLMSASPPKQGRTGIFRSVPTGFLKITLLAGISYCAIPVTEANAQAPAKHHSTTKKSTSKVAAPVQQSAPTVPATSPTPATAASTITRVQKKDLQQVESVRSEHVTVTGSLLHDPNVNSMSPITHISRADMARRGFANVTDALQALSSNGAGSLTNAFSANGAFAGGASAPSLRGLSSDSTLVLMDGQRLSYYPLSDDGQRNFVDTNWIPSSIMESTDVLEDGAATRYGADAVAGVINYVTRKEIKGFEGNAEGGLSQRGDSGHQKLYATYGFGDLRRDGYNVYINSEYQQDDALYNRQLGYPYKTGDLTKLGGENGNTNVLGSDGSISNFGATPATVVRPSNGSTSGVGPYQLLNTSAGCGSFGSLVSGYVAGTPAGSVSQACTQNAIGDYSQVSPSLRRINATIHTTVQVTPRSQLTAMFTYSQALSTYTGTPVNIRVQSQARAANTLSTPLPVDLPDGTHNPNNPFNVPAQVIGMFSDIQRVNTQLSQNFRGSARYNGSAASNWGSDWNYDVNFVGMNTTLEQTILGVPTIRGIQDAITNGTYNFVNPSKNTNAVRNAIAPPNVMNARTQEYSGEMSLSKGLFKLPGGTVDLAIGGNVRYESLNDPSANPYDPSDPTAQYTGAINPFNAQGSRWVESGFFEVGLPFHKMLSGNIAGRYDHYSEGFSHYTPKAGLIFTPVKQFSLRGTFSRGFRVPSFAETGGSNVGYTTYQPRNQAWLNQHLNPNGTPDTYAQSYSIGSNVAGNPNLKPEIATNFTGGALIKPTDWLNFSFDYYYIKKSNYIAPNPVSTTSVAEAYLAGESLPPGVSVTPDIVDTQHPDAAPRPALINLGYLNTNKVVTDGVDFKISATSRLPGALHDVRWISTGSATYVHSFNLTTPDGQVQHYAGTIGPYGAVSASGTPRWRANWSNTFIYKSLAVTPTVYYTSGYKTVAEDQTGAGTRNTCSSFASIQQAYTPNQCHTKAFWDVDLNVNYRISDRWSVYANVYNLLGFKSPYDFATYGSYLYNSAWSQKGLVLRSFHFGVNVSL